MAWNELNVSRFDRFVRRLTGIRQSGVLTAAMGEMATVLPIPTGPEDDQPAGRVPFALAISATQNGAIGDYLSIAVENNLPGRIVVVQGLVIREAQTTGATAPSWRHYTPNDSRTLGPIAAGVQPRDGRNPLVPQLRLGNIASGSPAGRVITFGIAAAPELPNFIPLPPIILPPVPVLVGTGFAGVAEYRCPELTAVGTVNITLNLWGWSREMDSSEDAP